MNLRKLSWALVVGALVWTNPVVASKRQAEGDFNEEQKKHQAVGSAAPVQAVDERELAKQAFLDANHQYMRDNPDCNIYDRGVWLKYLTRQQTLHLSRLYTFLRGKETLTREHDLLLNQCLFEFHNSFSVHQADFPIEFIDLIRELEPVAACKSFITLCGVCPRGYYQSSWHFPLVCAFLEQLPVEDRTLANLEKFAELLHAEKNDFGKYELFSASGTNERLMALSKAINNNEKVTMDNLQRVLATELSLLDKLKFPPNPYAFVGGIASLAATAVTTVMLWW